jgi:hypothetical protein
MPTSVHLPKPLLAAVDRRARALHISRNRLIVRALERELGERKGWSPDFFARLAEPLPGLDEAVDEMLGHILRNRRSKRPVRL